MPLSDEVNRQKFLTNAFLAGVLILGIKFRHNSYVVFVSADGVRCNGWIVGVGPIEPEPVYTIEHEDGDADEEVLESRIELISDPHVKSSTPSTS